MDAKRRSQAQLWYNYGSFIDTLEGVDDTPKRVVKKYPKIERTTAEPNEEDDEPEASKRFGRHVIENKTKYKELVSDAVINELLAIKNELEATRQELNITGVSDINKTYKKMFAVKAKLANVRDKLGRSVPKSLKSSIDILDKTASALRAGQVFYQGELMALKTQEVQQSIDFIKEFRNAPESTETESTTTKPEETIAKPGTTGNKGKKGKKGKKKPWKPHKLLEPEYITDKPGWWLYHPHLNLELDFQFDDEAELSLEIWSHHKKIQGTPAPKTKPTRTRNFTETEYELRSRNQKRTVTEYGTLINDNNKDTLKIRDKQRNNGSLKMYSKLKRADFDDIDVTKLRGIHTFDRKQKDESNIIRAEKIYVIAVVFCTIWYSLLF